MSERTMSCGRLLQFPPLPELPPPLRVQAFAVVEIAHQGSLAELTAADRCESWNPASTPSLRSPQRHVTACSWIHRAGPRSAATAYS